MRAGPSGLARVRFARAAGAPAPPWCCGRAALPPPPAEPERTVQRVSGGVGWGGGVVRRWWIASRQERQPTHLPSGAIFGREELVEGRSALLELKLGGGVVVARIGGQEGDLVACATCVMQLPCQPTCAW